MANVFKRLTGPPSRKALKRGNLVRGIGGEQYGPTSQTGYYSGVDAPEGGYVVTTLNTSNLPEYRIAHNDNELIPIANNLGGNVSNVNDAKVYLTGRSNTWLINSTPTPAVTDDLVLYYDPSNITSYPGTGNKLYDLSGKGNDATLYNSPVISGGFITWNGSNEYAQVNYNSSMAGWNTEQTVVMWLKHNISSGRRNPWDQAYGGYSTWTHEHGGKINNYFGDAGRNSHPYVGYGSNSIPKNVWNLVATTRNTSQHKWYLNGAVTHTRNHNFGTLTTDTNRVRIARGYAGYWQGKMGPVMAYDRALSADEITSLYYGGNIVTNGLISLMDSGILGSFDSGETIAYDIVGGNNGTLTNGVSHNNTPKTWLFDGTNDYIQMPSDIFTDNGSYTLSAWLKPNGSSWGNNAIPLYNTYSGNSSYGFWHHFGHDNVLRWRHGGTSYTVGDLSGIGLVADTWQLTTITWDRTTLRLYKNGQQVNSTTAPSDFRRSGAGARIGMLNYRRTSSDYNWNGCIANHHVYDRALSKEEVLQNYNAQRSRFGL